MKHNDGCVTRPRAQFKLFQQARFMTLPAAGAEYKAEKFAPAIVSVLVKLVGRGSPFGYSDFNHFSE